MPAGPASVLPAAAIPASRPSCEEPSPTQQREFRGIEESADPHWTELRHAIQSFQGGSLSPRPAKMRAWLNGLGATAAASFSASKSFPVGEARRLELRWEALNAFNHPQFTQAPDARAFGSPTSRFLN